MEENRENTARLTDLPTEILTDDLPNMNQECYYVTVMMFGSKYKLNINKI
jgi:hypothetical protein